MCTGSGLHVVSAGAADKQQMRMKQIKEKLRMFRELSDDGGD